MDITQTATADPRLSDVKLWHCRGCGVVHMSVGGRVMNFHRQEFAAFAEAVVEAQYSIGAAEPFMPELFAERHASIETIH